MKSLQFGYEKKKAHVKLGPVKVVVKEIGTIKKKSGTLYWDNRKDAKPHSLQPQGYKIVNSLEGLVFKNRELKGPAHISPGRELASWDSLPHVQHGPKEHGYFCHWW